MTEQKFQRRTVIVKRQLQLKYIALVFFAVLLGSVLIGTDIYYNLSQVILNNAPYLITEVQKFNSLMLARLLVYLVVILLISVFVSHRFAGPIYRFEKSAQAVSQGDLTHRVSLRTGDELLELQEEFNGMIASLQALVQKDRNLVGHLVERIEETLKKLPENAGAAREDLKSLRVELQHLTQSFKV